MYQCDDGNTVNGDGCSGQCMIEAGWTCSGGSPTSRDYCHITSTTAVNFEGNSPSSYPTISMTFSEEVTMIGSWENTLLIMLMPNLEEVMGWMVSEMNQDPKKYLITLPLNAPRNGDYPVYKISDIGP
jgi:hypothetical protein